MTVKSCTFNSEEDTSCFSDAYLAEVTTWANTNDCAIEMEAGEDSRFAQMVFDNAQLLDINTIAELIRHAQGKTVTIVVTLEDSLLEADMILQPHSAP